MIGFNQMEGIGDPFKTQFGLRAKNWSLQPGKIGENVQVREMRTIGPSAAACYRLNYDYLGTLPAGIQRSVSTCPSSRTITASASPWGSSHGVWSLSSSLKSAIDNLKLRASLMHTSGNRNVQVPTI